MKDYLLTVFEQGKTLDIGAVIEHMGVAVVLALVIFISYWITHAGTIYSTKFNVSLVMLTILTTTVITVIGNNVALSLGMVGALSIVRFRTAVKDSRDTVYIFWTIVTGIACGISEYLIATVCAAFLFVVLLILGRIRNDGRRLLIIRAARNQERNVEAAVYSYFKAKAILRVLNSTPEGVELIYELSAKVVAKAAKSGRSVTEVLYELDNIEYVNLVTQNDEING